MQFHGNQLSTIISLALTLVSLAAILGLAIPTFKHLTWRTEAMQTYAVSIAVFILSVIPFAFTLIVNGTDDDYINYQRMRYSLLLDTYAELIWSLMGVLWLYLGYTAVLPGRLRNTWKSITPPVVMMVFWCIQDWFAYITAKGFRRSGLVPFYSVAAMWVMRGLGHGLQLLSVVGIFVVFSKRKQLYNNVERKFIPTAICGGLILLFIAPFITSIVICAEVFSDNFAWSDEAVIVNNVLVTLAPVILVFGWTRITRSWQAEGSDGIELLEKAREQDGWPRFLKRDRAIFVQQTLEAGRVVGHGNRGYQPTNAFGQPIPVAHEAPGHPAFPAPNAVYPTPARPTYA